MAVTVSQLKKDVFLHKASHLYYTPWVTDTTDGWKPGTDTYDIVDILADTIAIEQGDPTTETVDWEFGDSPLMSTSTKGERTIAASCIDMSFDIMEHVFGWMRATYGTGTTQDVMVYEPTGQGDSFATIVVTFHGATAPIIVLPKVSMSSKTTIGTLKTSTGSADLAGTAQSGYLSYGGGQTVSTAKTATTEMAILVPYDGEVIKCAISSAAVLRDIGEIDIVNNEISLVTTT